MFEIHKAGINDCETIFEFINLLAKYEKLEHEVATDVNLLRENLFNKNSSTEVYLGTENGIPVCFTQFFTNFSTFLGKPGIYLEDLYVKEAYRGKGYGKKMLRFLAGLAVARDCGRLEWSVLDWNESAIKFYRSLGAQAMDEWTVYRLSGEALSRQADLNK